MASNSTEPSDRQEQSAVADRLARRVQQGDEAAFDELVGLVGRDVYGIAYRMTGSREDADDLSQEVFVKVHRSIRRFAWRSSFRTWLYTLTANACRSGLRRTRRIGRIEAGSRDDVDAQGQPFAGREPVDPTDGPDRQVERSELGQQVQRAVLALPEEFREVIVLRDLKGMAYEEISEALGCNVGTVKSRIARGRMRLRDLLRGVSGFS